MALAVKRMANLLMEMAKLEMSAVACCEISTHTIYTLSTLSTLSCMFVYIITITGHNKVLLSIATVPTICFI